MFLVYGYGLVAAATGAGYIAKYWRNLTSKETEPSSESFSLELLSDVSGHLRSRYHANYIEPLDSIESSLRAQLYREYVKIEYVYNSVPLKLTPAVRPLLLISRASCDFRVENVNQSPSVTTYTEQELVVHNERGGEEPDDWKAEKSEATSKIEAELVAELERLELNMMKSNCETISHSNGVQVFIDQKPSFCLAETVSWRDS